jgi:hypothetical protein
MKQHTVFVVSNTKDPVSFRHRVDFRLWRRRGNAAYECGKARGCDGRGEFLLSMIHIGMRG